MPLIIMSGFPSSGKSKLASQIKEYFEKEKSVSVIIVSENDCMELVKSYCIILNMV